MPSTRRKAPASAFKAYRKSTEIDDDLQQMILATKDEFIAVGTSFHRTTRSLREAYEARLRKGVSFTFVTLSRHSDFALFAPQFNQTIEELRTEVLASDAALDALRKKFPQHLNFYPTKRCPNYRIYISDPKSERPQGIINFYGSSTDSPQLPAFWVPDIRRSEFSGYFKDAIEAVERKRARKKVFIIHGHSEAKWREAEKLVEGFGLDPVVLDQQGSHGSTTVIEKFEHHARECSMALAILTPDDWVTKKKNESYFQPRPNVLFEIGWFFAHLGRNAVVLLLQGEAALPTDLGGILYLRYHQNVSERREEIRNEMRDLELLE